jgi:hypothetical protein
VLSLDIDGDRISWQIGATEGESNRDDPKWMHGSWSWKDALVGRPTYQKVDGEPLNTIISMPEGDYPASMHVYRHTWTFRRFKKPRVHQGVEFRVVGGVPNGREKYGDWDGTVGFAISAERDPIDYESWAPVEAAAKLLKDRARYVPAGWVPPADARNPHMIVRDVPVGVDA